MDLLMVAREATDLPPTPREIDDPADARRLLPTLPHGQQVASLMSRLALGVLVLAKGLDRGAARAAIGVSIQRAKPRAVVLLGTDIGRDLLGEGLPLAGGIRELHSRPIAALGQANSAEIERILMDVSQKAGIPWAPPSARAAPARAVVRAEEVEAQAASLIEKQQWQAAIEHLRNGEPLGPRGTNMLGRALLQLGDKDGARHAFERTLASEPDNRIAQRQLDALGAN
jgi:tetratricopeptide (TPR) repeat protein